MASESRSARLRARLAERWSIFRELLGIAVDSLLANRLRASLTTLGIVIGIVTVVLMITLIVASIIGAGRTVILESGARLLLAVASLHGGGFLFGYVLSKAIGSDRTTARTISIEVGMQNSGLGVVLARQNFVDPFVAIPSAISSLFHSLIASALAAVWRRST